MIQCGYCGNWHTHSYEMCKDIHNRPVAPSTGIVGLSNRIENAMDSIAEIQKLKADHLAAMTALQARIKELTEALEKLLSYALQLELLVYPNATGGSDNDVVEIAKAALEQEV
jgi:hypothetical protein